MTITSFLSICFLFTVGSWIQQQQFYVSAGIVIPKNEQGNKGDEDLLDSYGDNFFQELREQGDTGMYGILADTLLPHMQEAMASSATLTPLSTVDVGCANGDLVEAFRSKGVANAYGMEGAEAATVSWPEAYRNQYYFHRDLTTAEALQSLPATDFVTTFEVAEHLPPASAAHMVQLLTRHKPKAVFFGAATEFQDRGLNPTHVNEQPMAYWVDRFEQQGYSLDAATSFLVRFRLIKDGQELATKYWWYPKNILVFRPRAAQGGKDEGWQARRLQKLGPLDGVFTAIEQLSNMAGDTDEFGKMWKRDWQEFGQLFRAVAESCTTATAL